MSQQLNNLEESLISGNGEEDDVVSLDEQAVDQLLEEEKGRQKQTKTKSNKMGNEKKAQNTQAHFQPNMASTPIENNQYTQFSQIPPVQAGFPPCFPGYPINPQQQAMMYMPFYQYPPNMLPNPTPQINAFESLTQALVLDKIPDLKGNEGSDGIRKFFKKFDVASESWSEKKRITLLESKLCGRAERAFNAAVNSEPYRYDSIRRFIINQLEETDSKGMEAFDTLMRGVHRNRNETIDELGEKISGLVRRAYPGLPAHLHDEYSIKHLIRSMDSPELALNLELSRRNAMSLDEFIALAARAEATQRVISRRYNRFENKQNFSNQYSPQRTQFYDQGTSKQKEIKCYSCGKVGHYASDCRNKWQPPNQNNVQALVPHQNSGANRNFATNSNSVELKVNREHFNNKQSFRNQLKQNMLKVEQFDEVNIPHVNAVHTAEISEFFEKDNKDVEEKSVEDKSGLVGKIIALRVNVLGKEALSIVDPGAQISLVNAGFLVNLLKSNEIKLNDSALKFSKSAEQVLDVNGNKVNSLGVVNLPIKRNGMDETLIRAHITKAPFGYELLLGTNCLKDIGFKLYDEPNDEMINFQEAERQKSGAIKIIFHTTIPPRSTKLVETRIEKEFEGKEILIAQEEESEIRIEPTLGCSEKGKVVVPVTNTSELPIKLKENENIGKVETVNQYGEAENFLYFDWDFNDVKVNFVGGTT
nr:unnamed protein product [Meloidogyne enterolobii]